MGNRGFGRGHFLRDLPEPVHIYTNILDNNVISLMLSGNSTSDITYLKDVTSADITDIRYVRGVSTFEYVENFI